MRLNKLVSLAFFATSACSNCATTTYQKTNDDLRIEDMLDFNNDDIADRMRIETSKNDNGDVIYKRIEIDLSSDGVVNFVHITTPQMDIVHIYDRAGKEVPYCWENLKPYLIFYTDLSGKPVLKTY